LLPAASSLLGPASNRIPLSIVRTFPEHRPLYLSAFISFAASSAFLSWYGRPLSLGAGLFFLELVGQLTLLWCSFLISYDLLALWRGGAPPNPARLLLNRMLDRFLSGDRPGNIFHSLVTLTPMMIAFTVVKDNIAVVHPFDWDKTFAHWDIVLGGGVAPWQILQPIFGHPAITVLLNFNYHLWFFLMFGVLMWEAFSPRSDEIRMQFMLAFCFAWFFVGSVLALIFSSAGPCFYDRLFPDHPLYAGQMAYLNSIGPKWVWSLAVQNDLWESYVTGSGKITGISAMPSMHVTIATLLALFGWRRNRTVGLVFSISAVMILIGSVHLAWHYAVDGLAGAGLAVLCWWGAGWTARRAHAAVRRDTDWPTVPEAV
jgi:hypothetical protein